MLNNFKVTKTYFKIIYWHFLHVFNLCHYIVKINRIIFKTLWICSENSGIGRRVKKVQMPWDTADVQCKQSHFTYLAIQKVTSKAFCFLLFALKNGFIFFGVSFLSLISGLNSGNTKYPDKINNCPVSQSNLSELKSNSKCFWNLEYTLTAQGFTKVKVC